MSELPNGTPHPGGPPEALPLIILEEAYSSALLGHSISPIEAPRAVYSLPLLTKLEARRLGSDEDTAQQSLIAMVRQVYADHGSRAPHFIDDGIRRPKKKEKSNIIVPGRFGR
jgi:hypothetical protein